MITKVLVANRGEIAIRAFRAAYELGIETVAVYPYEDRNSVHRTKADESYQIGEPGHPVRNYLSVEAIIATARTAGADAMYPGYGFLSENPDLAAACTDAGITFVGPSAEVLELTGNKARAIAAAKAAGLPVLASTPPSDDVEELLAAARRCTSRCSSRPSPAAAGAGCGESPTLRAARSDRGRCPGGGVGVRRRHGIPRTSRPRTPPHRSADLGRRPRKRHSPVRTRLQRATSPPEGHRTCTRPEHLPGTTRAVVLRCRRLRPRDRLLLCGNRGVPRRPRRPARLHRDEPPDPGRTHRHRGDHRRRPRQIPAPGGFRRIVDRSRA